MEVEEVSKEKSKTNILMTRKTRIVIVSKKGVTLWENDLQKDDTIMIREEFRE